jgi:hypothetical protein
MKPYIICPLTNRTCAEGRCAWWLVINGKEGCAIRALGSLVAQKE